jgi:hypothetical protein
LFNAISRPNGQDSAVVPYIFIDVAMRWVHPVLGLELQEQLSWLAERLPVYMVYTRSH